MEMARKDAYANTTLLFHCKDCLPNRNFKKVAIVRSFWIVSPGFQREGRCRSSERCSSRCWGHPNRRCLRTTWFKLWSWEALWHPLTFQAPAKDIDRSWCSCCVFRRNHRMDPWRAATRRRQWKSRGSKLRNFKKIKNHKHDLDLARS